jgi:rSAM/selenodomain-associated transferase 2
MRLSVIIPTLNEERRIGALLDSFREAEAIDELIVTDGGSTDSTCSIVKEHPWVRLIEAPRGRANQMNAGARAAEGDVLWFVHADVRVPRASATRIRRALEDTTVAGGAFRIRTFNDGAAKSWATSLLWLADIRSTYSNVPYGDQAIFVRRKVFQELGGFPEQPLMEDLEFSRRLRRRGQVKILRERVEVSGRRFLQRPIYYTAAINLFPLLYHLGVGPATLKRMYGDPR